MHLINQGFALGRDHLDPTYVRFQLLTGVLQRLKVLGFCPLNLSVNRTVHLLEIRLSLRPKLLKGFIVLRHVVSDHFCLLLKEVEQIR